MTTTLYRAGRVLSPVGRDADAFAVAEGRIVWIGSSDSVGAVAVGATVDLDGGYVAPAFVDAHVHLTQTGLGLGGTDLHGARGATDVLDAVAAAARRTPDGPILGLGWDETTWPDRTLPTAAELDRAAGGRVVYLARVDVHSAIASPALLAAAGVSAASGLVRRDEHHTVRRTVLALLSPSRIRAAQRSALQEAARHGIGCVHELSGPDVAGVRDLELLLDLAGSDEPLPEVVAYWSALGDVETPSRLGLRGGGGDLFCDGSFGSRTAALHAPYADDADSTGTLYHDVDAVAEHVVACVRAGLQTGFHAIGDRAIDTVLAGFERAAGAVGLPALIAGRHRLEHAELPSREAIARMARLGLAASVQPAFDRLWGGSDGMYAERLGPDRAARLNPWAGFAAAGVPMALGSDAPVTGFAGWGMVRDAVHHRTAGFGLSPRAAFAAATRGGRRAAGEDAAGVLVPGAPATFAVWDAVVAPPAPPDRRVEAWATDPDWGDAGLPDLATDPVCLRTVVRGVTVHDTTKAVGDD